MSKVQSSGAKPVKNASRKVESPTLNTSPKQIDATRDQLSKAARERFVRNVARKPGQR